MLPKQEDESLPHLPRIDWAGVVRRADEAKQDVVDYCLATNTPLQAVDKKGWLAGWFGTLSVK